MAGSNYVAYNLAQTRTDSEKLQARNNIGAAGLSSLAALQEQIDNIEVGAVSGYTPKGPASVATLNVLTGQENGWLYTMTDAGTLTDGGVAVVAGDTVAWNATNSVWYKTMNYAPAQYGTNEVHNLTTIITGFRTGDVIPVDGPSGTAKMSKDDLLKITAQNALAENVAPAFDPTRTSENPYKAGESVAYDGKTYTFKVDHYGAWAVEDVTQRKTIDDELDDLETRLGAIRRTINVSSTTTGAGVNYDFKFITGQQYKITIVGGSVNVYSRTGSTNIETIASEASNTTIMFTATADAELLRVYYVGTASVSVVYDKVDQLDVPALKSEVSGIKDVLGAVRTEFSVSGGSPAGAVNYDYAFEYGKRYSVVISGGNTVNLYVRNGNTNVQTIATDVRDTTIDFLCNASGDKLRVYYTGTASVKVIWDKLDNELPNVGIDVLNPSAPDYIYESETLVPPSVSTGNLTRLYGLWDDLVTAHSAFLTKSVIGRDASNTYDINAYTLHSHSDNIRASRLVGKNLKFIIVTGLHGDERKASISAYLLCKELLENRANSPHLKMLWDNCIIVFIPTANPWGYENNSRYNSNGVNLNRNFDYNWVLDPEGPNTYNYGGPSAASEAETQAISSLIQNDNDVFCAINHHNSVEIGTEGRVAYTASRFIAEQEVQQDVARVADDAMKAVYTWITGDYSTNAGRNTFINKVTISSNNGTMDDYVSMKLCKNCFLLEIPQYACYTDPTLYPNATDLDLQNMSVCSMVDYLIGYVLQNKKIMQDRTRLES